MFTEDQIKCPDCGEPQLVLPLEATHLLCTSCDSEFTEEDLRARASKLLAFAEFLTDVSRSATRIRKDYKLDV